MDNDLLWFRTFIFILTCLRLFLKIGSFLEKIASLNLTVHQTWFHVFKLLFQVFFYIRWRSQETLVERCFVLLEKSKICLNSRVGNTKIEVSYAGIKLGGRTSHHSKKKTVQLSNDDNLLQICIQPSRWHLLMWNKRTEMNTQKILYKNLFLIFTVCLN